MNTLIKSFALAALMMASGGLAPQFTHAQSSIDQNSPLLSTISVGQSQQVKSQTDGWQFDPSRQHRQFQRTSLFQYPMGGYYYDQPYWLQPEQPIYTGRISCEQGLSIVAASGYNSVKTISCGGRTYTYRAQRLSHIFGVSVSANRGTILGTTLD